MKYKRLTALLSASILLLSGCSAPKRRTTYTDTLFDTVISVQIFDSVDEDVLKGCEGSRSMIPCSPTRLKTARSPGSILPAEIP